MARVRWLTWLAIAVAAFSFPVVWLVAYQDHVHRRPVAALLVGAVSLGAAAAVGERGKSAQPPVPKLLVTIALIVSAVSLGSAVFWWFVNAIAIE